MTRTAHRGVSALLALVLALALLAASPRPAEAHDSCAVAMPAATGVVGVMLNAVNVFAAFINTAEAECPDKYADVIPKLDRDWVAAEDVAATATDPRFKASKANPQSNAPRTHAPCINGMAADFFPCDGIDLESHVSLRELGAERLNDIWGWTDPQTGKDFALVGATTGTAFVDITDTKRPTVYGFMPTASTAGGDSWRDIKVYEDHAYVVSEHTNHGVQVFDLTRLRDWDGTYTTYEPDTRYTGHGSAHNIAINEDTGFAYSVGAGPFSSQPQPNTVRVTSGAAAGEYLASSAAFGPPLTQEALAGDFVYIGEACGAVAEDLTGKIAIADRGTCNFTIKAVNAQDAGAVALVVANNQPGLITVGGSDPAVTIPAVMITQADGNTIKASLPAAGSVRANDPPAVCGTGLHMIDINDPKNPVFAGCFDDGGYVHDTQCVVYEGPDAEFHGREICFNSNGLSYSTAPGANFVGIVDVTDKSNPVSLAYLPYEGSGYSHQGWLTEDQAWFLHGDEGDEILRGVNTTTRVWDVSDLRNPRVHEVFVNDTTSIDHNLYTKGDRVYASNYTTGLRVKDSSDLADRGLREVAFFDMYPENDAPTFEGGTWSNYPYYGKKGLVAVSSIDRGLFVLRARGNNGS